MNRIVPILLLVFSASIVGAQLSDLKAGMSKWMRLKVHTKDEIVACSEKEGLSSFFEAALITFRKGGDITGLWIELLGEYGCALLRPGDGVIVLGITPDGDADENVIERGEIEIEDHTYDILLVEIIPNPNINALMTIVDGKAVQISGEGKMWVMIDYLERYTSYW